MLSEEGRRKCPIFSLFGKDLGQLIYRHLYQQRLSDINEEYHRLYCLNGRNAVQSRNTLLFEYNWRNLRDNDVSHFIYNIRVGGGRIFIAKLPIHYY